MAATRFLARLARAGLRIFTTADAAHLADSSPGAACQTLRRLRAEGLVARLKRGVWANLLAEDLHPFEAVPLLAAPWPAYVSLHSALHFRGLLDQVPRIVFAVTSGRRARFDTVLGVYSIHRIRADLFWGFVAESAGRGRFPVAEAEKAILDALYLESRGVRVAGLFPELDLEGTFRPERLRRYLRRAKDPALEADAVRRGLLLTSSRKEVAEGARRREGFPPTSSGAPAGTPGPRGLSVGLRPLSSRSGRRGTRTAPLSRRCRRSRPGTTRSNVVPFTDGWTSHATTD